MDITKILEGKMDTSDPMVLNDVDHYNKILNRKRELTETVINITPKEKKLLEFVPILKSKNKKIPNEPSAINSWMDFLNEDERKQIIAIEHSDPLYQRIKNRCYIRRYYKDPENLKIHTLRLAKYRETKKLKKKEEFKKILPAILEERKKKLLEKKEQNKKNALEKYQVKKISPEYIESNKIRSKKYREEHKNYKRINYELKRAGLIELTPKQIERKKIISEVISNYSTLSDFRKNNNRSYYWIKGNGLTEELLGHFPDLIKREKYKIEKDSRGDGGEILLRRAKKNAYKCYTIEEYSKRFKSSYNFAISNNFLNEISKFFKTK